MKVIFHEEGILNLEKEDIDSIKIITDLDEVNNSGKKMNGVYFLHDGATLTKIGYSSNAKSRIYAIKAAVPNNLEFLGFIQVEERDDINVAEHIEHLIHHLYEDFRYKGEWFLTKSKEVFFQDCVNRLKNLSFPLCDNIIQNLSGEKARNDNILSILSDSSIPSDFKIDKLFSELNHFYNAKLSSRMLDRQSKLMLHQYSGGPRIRVIQDVGVQNIKIICDEKLRFEEFSSLVFSDKRLDERSKLLLLHIALNRHKYKKGVSLNYFLDKCDLNFNEYFSIFYRIIELGYLRQEENYSIFHLNYEYEDEILDGVFDVSLREEHHYG